MKPDKFMKLAKRQLLDPRNASRLDPRLLLHARALWPVMARPDQTPPKEDWDIWLLLGGRGSGKTRAGAEWVHDQVWNQGKRRIAIVGQSLQDVRDVMIDGDSGLRNIGYVDERPTYRHTRRLLEWPNGAQGHIFSAEDPESLRGPQFDAAWGDEFCAWRDASYVLANLQMGLRLGETPQLVITTTPKPIVPLFTLIKAPGVVMRRSQTWDNAAHLSPGFLRQMDKTYAGTERGRQELDGEIIDEPEGGQWSRALLAACREDEHPVLDKVIVAVDPPARAGPRSNACGIIVIGLVLPGQTRMPRTKTRFIHVEHPAAYVLHDATAQGLTAKGWAQRVVDTARAWEANYVVAEINQGGDMVRTILQHINPDLVVRDVWAYRGKASRSEPVSMLYERGRVKHMRAARLGALEDELVCMGSHEGYTQSPDRADALVWGITDLLIKGRAEIRARVV